MSHHDRHAYSNGYPPQPYPGPHYNRYVDPGQTNSGAINGYAAPDSNTYQTNTHYSSYGPPLNTPHGIQTNQQVPQVYLQSSSQQPQYNSSRNQQTAPSQQRYLPPSPQQQRRPPLPHQQPQRLPHPPQQQAFAVAIPASSPPLAVKANPGYVHMSEIQEQAIPTPPPLDYPMLLLSMADEYFAAAYEHGVITNTAQTFSEKQDYYRLIATGLGCLDSLLKRCKLPPEREANVRLRYATILYEETENTMEAEEVLSRGISACDRYKHFDLKYNMQHLLARVTFTKNAKAAFKFLEQVIIDANAYQHIAWEYAFRFLKVSLHLQSSSSHDVSAAISQLRMITSLAPKHGDKAILAMATTMEAMLHLREPGESGGFEQAQRALASVRSLQLDPAIANIPQLTAFISFVDISCHLQRFDPQQAHASMQNMQNTLTPLIDGEKKNRDGSLALPVSAGNMPPSKIEDGIIRLNVDGSLALIFNWMPNDDIYNVGYLMSGIAMAHKNTTDGHKSEQMFSQGVHRQQWAQEASDEIAKSVILSVRQQSWREKMAYYMRLYYGFILASRTSWVSARDQVAQVTKLQSAWPDVPNDLFFATRYLKGTIAQGTGDLLTAYSIFESIVDDICPKEHDTSGLQSQKYIRNVPQLDRELYILSIMNLVQIIRNPDHPNHYQFDTLLAKIVPHCAHSPNRGITSAYHIINAVCPASSKIIATKQSLVSALDHAKTMSNNKLVCMILNIMSWKFFSGVIVEQAEKSAQAGLALAKKCGDTLWISVAAGVMAESLEAAGRLDEAAQARAEGEQYARELPQKIQEVMVKTPVQDMIMAQVGPF